MLHHRLAPKTPSRELALYRSSVNSQELFPATESFHRACPSTLSKCLASQQALPNPLALPRSKLLQRLTLYHREHLYRFDGRGANRVRQLAQGVERIQGATLEAILQRSQAVEAGAAVSFTALSRAEGMEFSRLQRKSKLSKAIQYGLVVALSMGTPMIISNGGPSMGLELMGVGALSTLSAFNLGPDPNAATLSFQRDTIETAALVNRQRDQLISMGNKEPKPHQAPGVSVGRQEIISAFERQQSRCRTSLELATIQRKIDQVRATPGEHASQLYANYHQTVSGAQADDALSTDIRQTAQSILRGRG